MFKHIIVEGGFVHFFYFPAIPEADKSELEAISEVFCKGRKDPLLVGSVFSNIGYTEASSGLCAVVKVPSTSSYPCFNLFEVGAFSFHYSLSFVVSSLTSISYMLAHTVNPSFLRSVVKVSEPCECI
jgi:hypothetical protein